MTELDPKALQEAIFAYEASDMWQLAPSVRLYAAIAAYLTNSSPAGDGWQPIETAPRDGSWFLGYLASRYGVENTIDVWHLAKIGGKVFWQNKENIGALDFAPTHWRPLPASPRDEVAHD